MYPSICVVHASVYLSMRWLLFKSLFAHICAWEAVPGKGSHKHKNRHERMHATAYMARACPATYS